MGKAPRHCRRPGEAKEEEKQTHLTVPNLTHTGIFLHSKSPRVLRDAGEMATVLTSPASPHSSSLADQCWVRRDLVQVFAVSKWPR